MPLLEFEKTLTCPYNPAHQITAARMGVHLTKCRKNHPNSGHVICPFNANHHIPKPEERFHMSICGDRKSVELQRFRLENTASVGSTLPNVTKNGTDMVMTENWEDETVTGTYDPSKAAANANVLRKLEGATPSQRKEFRLKEKDRLERLASGLSVDGSEDLDRTLPIPGLALQSTIQRHSVPLRRPSRVNSTRLPTCDTLLQVHLARGKPLPGSQEYRRPGAVAGTPSSVGSIGTASPVGSIGTGSSVGSIGTSYSVNSSMQSQMLVRGRGRGLQIIHGGFKKVGGMQGC